MKKKKLLLIFSFITVFLFSIFILPPMDDKNVSAASKVDFWSGDFKYRVKPNKTLMVIASKDKAVLRIPSKVKYKNKTYKVTIIESYSTMRRKGKKNEVKKVILPSTIKTIKNSLMGNAKFISVSKKNKYFSSSRGILFDKKKKTLLAVPKNTTIKNYTVPKSVTKIGKRSFLDVKTLEKVTIPKNVKKIDDFAFAGSKIRSIKMTNGLKKIGEHAFGSCRNLKSLKLPNSIIHIGVDVIQNTPIKTINIPKSLKKIPNEAFYLSELTSIKIPNNIKIIGKYAFQGSKLESIVIPKNVKTIDKKAFAYTPISKITFEKGSKLRKLDAYVFGGCKNLKSVKIPSSIKSIHNQAFYKYNFDYSDFLIYGKKGTEAEKFAKRNNITFKVY